MRFWRLRWPFESRAAPSEGRSPGFLLLPGCLRQTFPRYQHRTKVRPNRPVAETDPGLAILKSACLNLLRCWVDNRLHPRAQRNRRELKEIQQIFIRGRLAPAVLYTKTDHRLR